jgi:hypothetical protein
MNTRERFVAVMNFQPVDRLPMIESYWWWDKTATRWHAEGLPQELTEHTEIARWFGLDTHRIFWISPRSGFRRPPGRTRDQGYAENAEEYAALTKGAYEEVPFDRPTLEKYAGEQARGVIFLWMQIDGFFWYPREILGIERHLFAFFDQPDVIHRINEDLVEFHLRTLGEVCAVATPDMITFAEDMSYNHGPMLSREMFDEFLAPYYRKIVPELEKRGILPFVDSDGDITAMIPWLESVGLVGVTPIERRAGNDIRKIREMHPRFRMLGAFDKTVMHLGEDAMREEFERILPVLRSGGYVSSVDHQTPPEVSLEDYRQYVRLLREYCEMAGGIQ